MPNRYRVSNSLLGIAIGIGLLFLFAGLANQANKADRAYQTSKQEYQGTKKLISLGGISQSKQTNPKAYRDEWRNEYDLKAQREMAEWAWWMLLTSAAGVGITAIGVFFVAETLKAAIESNRLLGAALTAEVAPFLSIKIIEDGKLELTKDGLKIDGSGGNLLHGL
jgi:hypothetical protein